MKAGIIKHLQNDYVENNKGVREERITFFGITLFHSKITSTDKNMVNRLTETQKTNIKGFK